MTSVTRRPISISPRLHRQVERARLQGCPGRAAPRPPTTPRSKRSWTLPRKDRHLFSAMDHRLAERSGRRPGSRTAPTSRRAHFADLHRPPLPAENAPRCGLIPRPRTAWQTASGPGDVCGLFRRFTRGVSTPRRHAREVAEHHRRNSSHPISPRPGTSTADLRSPCPRARAPLWACSTKAKGPATRLLAEAPRSIDRRTRGRAHLPLAGMTRGTGGDVRYSGVTPSGKEPRSTIGGSVQPRLSRKRLRSFLVPAASTVALIPSMMTP